MEDDKELKTYRMLYLQAITQSYTWLQEQSPYLWLAFQNTIYTLIKIEEYKQEIEKCEQEITNLDLEIKQANRIVAGEEAVLGWAGKYPLLAGAIENLQKAGLSTVPIVTLFAITGVNSVLNPFVKEQERWGVIFLLWSSVAFVLLTSSGIIKLIHRSSRRHWQEKFLFFNVRTWFIVGCFLFGLIEGIGGGYLATTLINRTNEILINTATNRGSSIPTRQNVETIKITAIISLFAYLNIFFSIAKGKEVRILQSNKIRRDRASKVLKSAIDNRKDIVSKIKAIEIKINGLVEENGLAKEIGLQTQIKDKDSEILTLSNKNTSFEDFVGKHPGTYDRGIPANITNGKE